MTVCVQFTQELTSETNARSWNPQIPTEGVHEKILWVRGIWSLLCKWTAWCDPAERYESSKRFLWALCRIDACKWNSSFSDNQAMKFIVKIRQFYWWRKNNMSCFKEIKQNLPHVYGLGCSVCLKQIFCNANGAITPVRLQHFSHLVQWFLALVYENGGAITDIQSGCVTAMHPIHSMGVISIVLLFWLHNLHRCKMCDGISSLPLHNIIKLVTFFFTFLSFILQEINCISHNIKCSCSFLTPHNDKL